MKSDEYWGSYKLFNKKERYWQVDDVNTGRGYCRDFCWTDIQSTVIASDGYRFYRNPANTASQWLRLHLVVQQTCVGAHIWSQTPPGIFVQPTAIASDGYRFYRNPGNTASLWLCLHLVVQQKCVGAHMWSQTSPGIFVRLMSFLVEWCIDFTSKSTAFWKLWYTSVCH